MESVIARGIQILLAFGGAYLVALWFVLIVWTFRDIETRSKSVVTQVFSTLLVVLFFLPGVLLYLILRPKETLDIAFQRTLEEEYLLQDLEELPVCSSCQHYIEDDFMICPNCQSRLRDHCPACARLVDLRWAICPYCETDQSRTTVEIDRVPEPAARWIAPTALHRRMLTREGRSVAELEPPGARVPEALTATRTQESQIAPPTQPPVRLFDRRKTREAAALLARNVASTNGSHGPSQPGVDPETTSRMNGGVLNGRGSAQSAVNGRQGKRADDGKDASPDSTGNRQEPPKSQTP